MTFNLSLRNQNLLIVPFLLIAIVVRLIFPGDAPFILDEPHFLELGLKFKETLNPMIWGMKGKMGLLYGPYTSWFFGALFFITDNLIHMVFLKSLIITAMTFTCCWWLKNLLTNFQTLFLLPVFGSLFLLMDARHLWELNIPSTIVAFTFYIAFIKYERLSYLVVSVVFLSFALLTHLMCLPLVLAIVLHFFIYKWTWILQNKLKLLLLAGIVLLLNGPYFYYLLNFFMGERTPSNSKLDMRAFVYALNVGRLFTTHDFSYFLGKNWMKLHTLPDFLNSFIAVASGITWLAYPVSWFGIFKVFQLNFQKIKKSNFLYSLKGLNLKEQVLLLSLAVVVFHLLLSFYSELRGHPHYYNGVWPAGLVLFWFGLENFWNKKYFQQVYLVYCSTLFFYLIHCAYVIHNNGGSRSVHYGPTLSNQYALAQEIKKIKNPDAIEAIAFHPKNFPQALSFLIRNSAKNEQGDKYEILKGKIDYANDYGGKIILQTEKKN